MVFYHRALEILSKTRVHAHTGAHLCACGALTLAMGSNCSCLLAIEIKIKALTFLVLNSQASLPDIQHTADPESTGWDQA